VGQSGDMWCHLRGLWGILTYSGHQGQTGASSEVQGSARSKVYYCPGFGQVSFCVPGQEWEPPTPKKIKDMPLNQKDSRAYARYFLSGATEAEPDKQGRILVPLIFGITQDSTRRSTCLGVGTRLEVWNKDLWDGMKASIQESFSEIAESIGGL